MKKVFLLAVALLAFCAAKAQPAVGDFTWGAKVGFNATNISNFDAKNKMPKNGTATCWGLPPN